MKMNIRGNRKLLLEVLVLILLMSLTGCGKKVKGVLQIQNLENVSLEEDTKFPHELKMYEDSLEAYNNPVTICVKDKGGKETQNYISISFTDERFYVRDIGKGILIEKNQSYYHITEINKVGDIQTFILAIPYVEKVSTIVYEIKLGDREDTIEKSIYIAFRITQ